MNCRDCVRYNHETRECRDKKVNPQSMAEAADVANVFGVRSICMFNDFRERLIASRLRTVTPSASGRPSP